MVELQLQAGDLAVFDEAIAESSAKKWDEVAKPLGSLGRLEEAVIGILAATSDPDYTIDKRAVVTLCAANGVVDQGVTMTPGVVTTILAKGLAENKLTVNTMAAVAHADVFTVDMGIAEPLEIEGLLDRRIGPGTGDISQGPAMSREQALQAMQVGIDLVRDLKEQGYKIICTGEAGIGNTTSSSAITTVLLDGDPVELTGRGVGLSDEGLAKKVATIKRAIEVNAPDVNDAI
ncbi:MAG TPA: nicotinate-nucleotide--dimethylbenzimidazole phosphoribosyltransferase, partial [Coriobacteriia bacterium]|nr:nicotinate-nucleotide--dimethylbenzimidazole phosphoribosyltransferase [Coriobacteriia bacterium]